MRFPGLAGRLQLSVVTVMMLAVLTSAAAVANLFRFPDPMGDMATYNTLGAIDLNNPFFQSLGTNGRSCATCHLVSDAMGLSSASAAARFASTRGNDPLFADVDGANCLGVSRSDASAHSLLVNHGLLRIELPVPDNAQFIIETIYDPYGCADTTDFATGKRTLSVYRRPLPSANLKFLSAVMFDGRETVAPLNNPGTFATNLHTDLMHQAVDATLGHAQAQTAPTTDQVSAIVRFEMSLFSSQLRDNAAGTLEAQGATGGPLNVSTQGYFPGINDSLGSNPTGAPFDNQVFTIFSRWADLPSETAAQFKDARETIAAGEEIFNTFPLKISGVGGLNDALHQTTITGTCTSCHDTPNVGNHSLPVPLDIGVSHAAQFDTDTDTMLALSQLSVPELPVFKVTCRNVNPPRVVYTSDPGKALISGLCSDLMRVKGPILRGLAARAPYFHNGAAASLMEVVNFYDERFKMGLTEERKRQLVAFLGSL
jgi:cytochrome c peroxidase